MEQISEYALDFVHELVNDKYVGSRRNYVDDAWSSDWNGDEVGFPTVDVVGLYSFKDAPIEYYVNTETGVILEAWLCWYL